MKKETKKLSADSRTVLRYLIKNEKKKITRKKISKEFGLGKHKMRRITSELRSLGILHYKPKHKANGRFAGWLWKINKEKLKELKVDSFFVPVAKKNDRKLIGQIAINQIQAMSAQIEDANIQKILSIAEKKIHIETQTTVDEKTKIIRDCVENLCSHTYDEIAEDSGLPDSVVRSRVKVLVDADIFYVKERLVAKSQNTGHLIYSNEKQCNCIS